MSVAVKRIASSSPSASLIFLHGLGDTSDGWLVLAQEIQKRPDLQHINIVLPTAPTPIVSAFGQASTSWFDIKAMGPNISTGNDGYLDTIKIVEQLVAKEVESGIPADRVVVGGFSQGAAITLSTAILEKTKLGGFIAHSGFLPDELKTRPKSTPANVDSPLLLVHGESDDVVGFKSNGEPAYKSLVDFGFSNITFKTYPALAHTASLDSLNNILSFLSKNISKK